MELVNVFPLNPIKATILYGAILALFVAAVYLGGDVANAVLVDVCTRILTGAWIGVHCHKRKKDGRRGCCGRNSEGSVVPGDEEPPFGEEEEAPRIPPSPNDTPPLSSPYTGPRRRVHYLDNLKVILTAIVVIHHTTCAFTGIGWNYAIGDYIDNNSFKPFGAWLLTINQSYFMVLFFFVSGYFTVGSIDRKGPTEFLLDRFQRILMPLFVVMFVFWPSMEFFVFETNKNSIAEWNADGDDLEPTRKSYQYRPAVGHAWFLLWLLLFSAAYASVASPKPSSQQPVHVPSDDVYSSDGGDCDARADDPGSPRPVDGCASAPAPSPAKLLCLSYGLGVLLGALIVTLKTGSFVSMPLTIGSLPLDIAAYILGVKAGRHGWLEKDFTWYYFGRVISSGSVAVRDDLGDEALQEALTSPAGASEMSETLHPTSEGLVPGSHGRRRLLLWVATILAAVLCWMAANASKNNEGGDEATRARHLSNAKSGELLVYLFALGIFGIICLVFCAWWLMVSKSRLDYATSLLKWTSSSSYGVYLIHPWVVNASMVLCVKIFDYFNAAKDGGSIIFVHRGYGLVSSTELGSDGFLWIGWTIALVLNLILSWAFAGALKCIPFLKNIL